MSAVTFALDPPLHVLRAVCPACRRIVRHDRPCELDGHEVFELGDAAQRARMVDATWGPAAARDELRREADRLGTRRTRSSWLSAGTSFCGAYAATSSVGVSATAAAFGGILGAFAIRRRGAVLVPSGAKPLPEWPRVAAGKIVAGPELIAPAVQSVCAAWAVELRYHGSWGTRITLRAGVSAGLDIVLDGGAQVRIPAGALWIAGELPHADDDDASIDDLLTAVDPFATSSDWRLFPFNVVVEQALYIGDRVEVLGELESRPLTDEGSTLYRETIPSVLVHTALPVLRWAR